MKYKFVAEYVSFGHVDEAVRYFSLDRNSFLMLSDPFTYAPGTLQSKLKYTAAVWYFKNTYTAENAIFWDLPKSNNLRLLVNEFYVKCLPIIKYRLKTMAPLI